MAMPRDHMAMPSEPKAICICIIWRSICIHIEIYMCARSHMNMYMLRRFKVGDMVKWLRTCSIADEIFVLYMERKTQYGSSYVGNDLPPLYLFKSFLFRTNSVEGIIY